MKKLLLEMNFRLRNKDEYNSIKKEFLKNNYVILTIEEFDYKKLNIDFLFEYFNLNLLREKYEKIVFISNIEDFLVNSYRVYNYLADDFILFIDKYNYNLLDGEINKKIAEFEFMNEEAIDELYINITTDNIDKLEKYLKNPLNISYISSIDKINYSNEKKIKNKTGKKYLFKNEIINIEFDTFNDKIINLDKEKNSINIYQIFENFIKKSDMMIYYFILTDKKEEEKSNIIGLMKLYFEYVNKKENKKEIMKELYFNLENIKINFTDKCKLCSMLVMFGYKDGIILKIMLNELKKEKINIKYHFGILINIYFYNYIDKVHDYENFYHDMRDVVKILSDEYRETLENVIPSKIMNENYKIAIIADQILNLEHSSAKAVIDYAANIKKYIKGSEVKIFIEENYYNRVDEVILKYYNTYSKCYEEEHKNLLKEHGEEDIEIFYSNVNRTKEGRVLETVEQVIEFNPDIILNFNNAFSICMEYLSNYYNSYFLTLGTINYQENQIYNFYYEGMDEKKLPDFNNNIILKEKAIIFKEKKEIYKREDYGIAENDFVMISVSGIPEADFTEVYIDELFKLIKKYANMKLIIVGTKKLSLIEKKYKEMILEKRIIFIEYEKNLAALYKISNIYINPMRHGGGYSIGEAMFYGLPIVSFKGCRAGDSWYGEKNNIETFKEYTERIERLYYDKIFYYEFSEKSKKIVDSFKFENFFKKIFEYINKGVI